MQYGKYLTIQAAVLFCASSIAKPPIKKKQADHQQLARKALDAVVPDAELKADQPKENPAAFALGPVEFLAKPLTSN